MKRAVSISIGSSKRDKVVDIELLGEKVRIERIGTDGDMEKAAQLFKELDGKVDAFGVGGTDLYTKVDDRRYPLYSVWPIIRYVKQTPIADGAGLKNTLEYHIVPTLEATIGDYLNQVGRRVLITAAIDRWGMTMAYINGGYDFIFGDMMFGLGIPMPIRRLVSLRIMAAMLMPIVGRIPFKWIYPVGESQEVRKPRWEKYYYWASVIAGDCHYIKRHMPYRMDGKIITTNTTTPEDVELFRQAGVAYLLTSTPVLDGRSFGTNMMEAALIAVAGKGRVLTVDELTALLNQLDFQPKVQKLN
jgi:hypothetical protein